MSSPPTNSSKKELLANAVRFLQHPSVKLATDDKKRQFLSKKGLSEDDINEAFKLSNEQNSSPPPNPTNATSTTQTTEQKQQTPQFNSATPVIPQQQIFPYYPYPPIAPPTGGFLSFLSKICYSTVILAGFLSIISRIWKWYYRRFMKRKMKKRQESYREQQLTEINAQAITHMEDITNLKDELKKQLQTIVENERVNIIQSVGLKLEENLSKIKNLFPHTNVKKNTHTPSDTSESTQVYPFTHTQEESPLNTSQTNSHTTFNDSHTEALAESFGTQHTHTHLTTNGKTKRPSIFTVELAAKLENEKLISLESAIYKLVDEVELNGSPPRPVLSILLLFLNNILKNPTTPRYRKINLGSPRFEEKFGTVKTSLFEYLNVLGYESKGSVYVYSHEDLTIINVAHDFIYNIFQSFDDPLSTTINGYGDEI